MLLKRMRDSFMRLYCLHYCRGHKFGLDCTVAKGINRLISPKIFHEIFVALLIRCNHAPL